ncbi:unnamed protein product, partial [Bubo scandiacus]
DSGPLVSVLGRPWLWTGLVLGLQYKENGVSWSWTLRQPQHLLQAQPSSPDAQHSPVFPSAS